MEDNYKPNGHTRPKPLSCPICKPLEVGLLEITEDDGEKLTLFTFDCPKGDFHSAIREAEVKEMAALEVVRRMRLSESEP